MASAVPETMVPETSMPVRADKDAQKSEKTGAEEEKTILGKLYVAGIGPGSLDGMTKEAFKAIGDCQVTRVNGGQEYIVESGLQTGDVIVAEGVGLLREGTEIKAVNEER